MKTLLLTFALVLSFGWANAQEWQPVGPEFNNQPWTGYASVPSFAMDGQGNPYIGFYDYRGTDKATVRKYENGQWSTVGAAGFSESFFSDPIAVSPDGTVYAIRGVAGAFVSRFNGTSWEAAGSSEYNVSLIAIAVADDGTPYVAGTDRDQGNKTTVLRLVDDTWEIVGNAGFTNVILSRISLAIAPDGTPYITGRVYGANYRSVVMKLNDDTWETVGSASIWEGAGHTKLTVGEDATPYLSFIDSLDGYKATVMKFDGSNWQLVGDKGFTAGLAAHDIAIDNEGIPYVAYIDSALGRRITVKKFTNGAWVNAGNAGFSNSAVTSPSLLISPTGTPYVAYADVMTSVDEYLFKARVMRLRGDTWESVGNGGISGTMGGPTAMAVDPSGNPYIAYSYDTYVSTGLEIWHKTRVTKWNGTSWEKVGKADFLNGVSSERLAIDPEGMPYLAYSDSLEEYKVTVIRYTDGDWQTVGEAGFSEGEANPEIAISSSGTPYIAYSGFGNTGKAVVKTFTGSAWETVSDEGLSDSAYFIRIALDTADTPYVAYSDQEDNFKIKVKKFNDSMWENVGDTDISDSNTTPAFFMLNDDNQPVVAYTGEVQPYSLKIKVFSDNEWVELNTEDLEGKYIQSLVYGDGGILHAAYTDDEHDRQVAVVRYNAPNWEPVNTDNIQATRVAMIVLAKDEENSLFMAFSSGGIWAYQYEQECTNPTDGGTIAGSQSGCDAFDPQMITSSASPSGHTGTLEYKWQSSTSGSEDGYTDISHNAATYDPGILNQTTWFRRLAKVTCMPDWTAAAVSDVVTMTVVILPELDCPDNDTVFNDPGTLFARKSYSALPEGTPDTLAIYMVNGQPITFPYDFPIGTTTVEVKASGQCAVDVACSFTVTVTPVTGLEDWNTAGAIRVYPNPFTREMAVEIANPSLNEVTVEIYSVSGQRIRSLAMAQKEAKISLAWDGTDEQGKQVPYGIYLLKVNEETMKVVKR